VNRLHVVFFGDSHVAGIGDPEQLGWSKRVLHACTDAGLRFTWGGLGEPGDTSLELLERWTHRTHNRLVPGPDIRIVISFGVNDTAAAPNRPCRVHEHRSLKLLGLMLDEMIAEGIGVFVVGPPPVRDPEHRERLEQLSVDLAAVCDERNVPYVSVFDDLLASADWVNEVGIGQGRHPGARGYQALADLVIEAGLVDWLSQPVTPRQGLPHRRQAPPGEIKPALDTPSRQAPNGPAQP
jgi:acyl-CoA thioesterase-1